MPERRLPGRLTDEEPELEDEEEPLARPTTSMISAYGAFRLLLIVLTVWTFFEGFALTTGALSPVDAGTDRTAERILGGLMVVLGGVYGMLAWQRERYRLLLWVPFAAQLAIVVPLLFDLEGDSLLLLVISTTFLVLMVYVWWRSRDIEEAEDTEEDLLDEEDATPARTARGGQSSRATEARREVGRRAGRFRRRDG
jgi:hypothetical protein